MLDVNEIFKKNGKTYKLVEIVNKVDERIEFFKKWSDTKYCLEAVKGNGYYLRYVKDQTEAICLEAVKGNADALQYVKDVKIFEKIIGGKIKC